MTRGVWAADRAERRRSQAIVSRSRIYVIARIERLHGRCPDEIESPAQPTLRERRWRVRRLQTVILRRCAMVYVGMGAINKMETRSKEKRLEFATIPCRGLSISR